MTEFAISVPVLLLIFLGVVEVGRALFQYNALTKGVRDGARFVASARTGSTGRFVLTESIQDTAANLTIYGNELGLGASLLPGLGRSDIVITLVEDDDYVRVVANYAFDPIFDRIPTFGFGEPIDLAFPMRAAVVMRVL